MAKKTVINIKNLNVNSLPASFYSGTRVNLEEVGLFHGDDDQDDTDVCHCFVCESERREAAQAMEDGEQCPCEECQQERDEQYTPGCPECDKERSELEREMRQDANIISQGLGLAKLEEEFKGFVTEVREHLKELTTVVSKELNSIREHIRTVHKTVIDTNVVNVNTSNKIQAAFNELDNEVLVLKKKVKSSLGKEDSGSKGKTIRIVPKTTQEVKTAKQSHVKPNASFSEEKLGDLLRRKLSEKSEHYSDTDRNR